MPTNAGRTPEAVLWGARHGFILHQAIYAAAELGIADQLADGARSVEEAASATAVDAGALYRVLRLLVSEGIFEEVPGEQGCFRNNSTSELLRSGVQRSMRSLFLFWASEFCYPSFGEILYSVETGLPSRTKLSGMDGFSYLRERPDLARIFDDAMTAGVENTSPAIAAAYDFSRWESLMDVGGGNGILLAHILRAHPGLRGVLADQPHVLARAHQRGYLGGDLEARATATPCDFFREIPSGCRAYMMSRVIHDWNDEQSALILSNCRRAMPADGVLLLVENVLGEPHQPTQGKYVDVTMLLLTGGRERTEAEYAALLAASGFRLNHCYDTCYDSAADFRILEAFPV